MDYKVLVRDFAYRTRKNLEALRDLQRNDSGAEVYEVTQLINSMLGLIVLPRERDVANIPLLSLQTLKEQGWPVPTVTGQYPDARNLRELARYLRNAIAHFNLEFQVDGANQIIGLRVWNTNPDTKLTTWEAQLTLQELEEITTRLVDVMTQEQPALEQ